MKKILTLLICCLMIGCQTTQELTTNFEYIKDSRTNLCFASYSLGSNHGTMTNVPCTPEVEEAIKQDQLHPTFH